jgi:hypothetical protein
MTLEKEILEEKKIKFNYKTFDEVKFQNLIKLYEAQLKTINKLKQKLEELQSLKKEVKV